MGNIVFDGLSALSFTKQLDEYGTEVILSMETIRHSVERVFVFTNQMEQRMIILKKLEKHFGIYNLIMGLFWMILLRL